MTICVRDRFSATRSLCVSPTLIWLALSAMGSAPLHRTFGCHANATRSDDKLAILVAIFRYALAKCQLARTFAFAFPGVARLCLHRQHIAGTQRAVIFEVLLGM